MSSPWFFCVRRIKKIENFVRNNAVEFAKRKMSITYLLLDEYSRVCNFAITHKAVQIWGKNLSSTVAKKDTAGMHKKMRRQMNMLFLLF